MEELLKVNDKQDMNKYENSINRISFKIEEIASNLGLDLDDQPLSEDIKSIYELLDRCDKLEKSLDEACDLLEHYDRICHSIDLTTKEQWKEWLMKDENDN